MDIVHLPVMVEEVVKYLAPASDAAALLVDCTLGEGGHSERFLKSFPGISVCGVDADAHIQAKAKERLQEYGPRVRFYNMWYDDFFAAYPLDQSADRILFDLGISIYHYVESGRGFSFTKEEPLDMRLSETAGQSVAEFLEDCTEKALADVIYQYGEERYSYRIAKAILALRQERGAKVFRTMNAAEFSQLIWNAVPADYRHGRIHPATRTFQALRIKVNRELERIESALQGAFEHLRPGGRLGVISFHSLEDRLVKTYFRDLARDCVCGPEQPRCVCGGVARAKLLTRKAVQASDAEISINPPSRSAKWRVIEKV